MNLSEDNLLELMAYADDELDADARARVEGLLSESAEARGVVASFGLVARVVEHVEDERAVRAGADRIVDGVMSAIRVSPVVPISSARASTAWRWAGAGALVAMAAGYALVAGRGGHDVTSTTPLVELAALGNVEGPASSASSAGALPPLEVAEDDGAGQGVDVDHIESPTKPVSVIYVPATATANLNVSSVVIWINEDERPGGH